MQTYLLINGVEQGIGAVTPPPVTATTIFGFNLNTDTSFQTLAGRKAQFNNRAPCVRAYGSPYNPGDTFSGSFNTSNAPEKRVCYSFKEGNGLGASQNPGYTSTQLSNGTVTALFKTWLQSIPANWTVFWVYHHEPNSGGILEVPAGEFLGVYHQMRLALNSATLASGTHVYITCNFMAFQTSGSSWSDSWVPPRADCDIFTWDIYGNPGNLTSSTAANKYGPNAGDGGNAALDIQYGTTYPLASARTNDMFNITERTGFADSWGILEINGPLRNWDKTTVTGSAATGPESGRVLWHKEMMDLVMDPPMTNGAPPKIVLLWEAVSGANWNQAYGSNLHLAKNGNYTPYANRADSPMWDFWFPYITGTPVGGV